MGKTRVFLPQHVLNGWLEAGKAEFGSGQLTTKPDGHRYRVVESVRVLAEVTGGSDSYELVGKVKPMLYVRELGAELLGDSMVLEDNAYDIVLGWVAMPLPANLRASVESLDKRPPGHQAEAEALAQFLARNL